MWTQTVPRMIRMTFHEFEAMRESGRAKVDQPYAIAGRPGEPDEYAITPDGEGFFFYETYEELRDEHL